LNSGSSNTIRLESTGSDYGNLDEITVSGTNELLSDNFGDGYLNGWTVVDEGVSGGGSANWTVQNGEAHQNTNTWGFGSNGQATDNDRTGTFAYWDNASAQNWANYTLSLDIRSTDDDGIGAMVYYQDANNYYLVDIDRQQNFSKLIKKENGNVTLLDSDNTAYTQGQTQALEVSINNGSISVSLDGSTILSATDNALSSGTVAMYCWANNGAFFDNVAVNSVGSGARFANAAPKKHPIVPENKAIERVKVYPNPTSERLHVELNTEDRVQVTDLSGKVIFNQKLAAGHSQIDLTVIPTGIYIISVGSMKTRFIKK